MRRPAMRSVARAATTVLALVLASAAGAQEFMFYPYYGKNKVIYETFRWKTYPTEHFRIHFYMDEPQALQNVAELAESAYLKLSETLKHQLSDPVPLIYYTTFTDFELSNVFDVSEGVLGVSEPLLHRIGIHGDMPLDELQRLIEHELAHIFEFDILWGSQAASLIALNAPPLWLFEGLSEYATQDWSSWSTMIVRDAVLNDRLPDMDETGDLQSRFPMPRDPSYDFGHAIYDFIESRFGRNAVQDLWQSIKGSPLLRRIAPVKKAFNMKTLDFNHEFQKYLREKNRKFLLRENPADYSIALGPKFPLNPYYFTFSHAVSPSGDLVAALTFNVSDFDVDLVLVSVEDGSIVKNVTRGFTTKYEYITYEYDPSLGSDIAWSADGDVIAFIGRDGRRYSLYLVDPVRGEITRKYRIDYDRPSAPRFFPDSRAVLFTAFFKGTHDIFKLDLENGEVVNLTKDDYFEKAPAISPDGQSIAYSIRLDDLDKLFLSPLTDLSQKTQLTFGQGNTTCPSFSADSRRIYFVGDVREAFNIYSVDLGSGEVNRYTDVWTGNFFPSADPSDPGKLFFSSFNKGSYQVYSARLEGTVEDRVTFASLGTVEPPRRFEPAVTLEVDREKVKPYPGLNELYIAGRPPIDLLVSSDGSLYGGAALSFGDLLGDHNFLVMLYQARGMTSYYVSYLNQKRRFQFMPTFYEFTMFYYPPYTYIDPVLYNRLTYRDAIAYRKITSVNIDAYYPLNRYYRLEGNVGFFRYEENFLDPYELFRQGVRPRSYSYFWNGNVLSGAVALVGETTHFSPYYGPRAGHTFRFSLAQTIPVAEGFFSNTTVRADLRKYLYLGSDALMAFRFEGWASRGRDPFIFYYGGNNQVRSSYFYNIASTEGWFANAELRLPLINVASTIIGTIGPIRGVLFFDVTRSKFNGNPAKFYLYPELFRPAIVLDAIGSFGWGIQLFFLGLPMHIEWVKQLAWADFGQPFSVQSYGGFEVKFWIGLDF
jgi:Tol biopolymer transport system component